MKKYNLFIGRWCPFHFGHKYIIDTFVNNKKPVCIAVRQTEELYPADLREQMIRAVYEEEIKCGLVKVMQIPDIEMICIGRHLGYAIVEVPHDIYNISGTSIRRDGFKDKVPEKVKKVIRKWENGNESKNGDFK